MEEHNHDIIIYNLTKEQVDEIYKRLEGLTYYTKLIDSEQ